jgi:hypothetical protein
MVTSDKQDLVEWALMHAEAQQYFCACGETMLSWDDVMEHLGAPIPAEVLALVG